MRLLNGLTLIFFSLSTYSAQSSDQTVTDYNDIISCSMMHGYITHKLTELDDGYAAYIAFQTYYVLPPQKILDEKKEEWRNWDGERSTMPEDPRKIGVSIPMTSSNVMNSDVNRLQERAALFDELFTPIDMADYIPLDFRTLVIKFKKENCDVVKGEDQITAFCSTDGPVTLYSGKTVDRISFWMATQKSRRIIGGENPKFITQNLVDASVNFLYKGQNLTSNFQYAPNGNDRDCRLEGEVIPQLSETW